MRGLDSDPLQVSETERRPFVSVRSHRGSASTFKCIHSRYKGAAFSLLRRGACSPAGSRPTRFFSPLAAAISGDGSSATHTAAGMQSINRMIWGPTPQEKVRKWQTQLKREQRMLDREVHSLDLACNKVKADIKRLAQKGDTKNAKLLAREVVRTNRQKQRMLTSKAQLNSINMQLGHQLGAVPFLRRASRAERSDTTALPSSNGQGDGNPPGVDRDHEGVKLAHQVAPVVQHEARDERRNDEGQPPYPPHCMSSAN